MSAENEKLKLKKQSSGFLNFILLIIGIWYIFIAIMDFLTWAGIYTPPWLDPGIVEGLAVLGSRGLISAALGFWCFIAAIGLWREEEYALGMGLILLSIMAIQFVALLITWISAPGSYDPAYWPNYVNMFTGAIGIIGFFYLLFTYKRYD